MSEAVDLVVNTFEATYRSVLEPGFFETIERQNCRRFDRTVALINNVSDRGDAERRAEELVRRGAVSAYYFVEDRLPEALRRTGLTKGQLGRALHYTDCSLVAVTLPGSPWLVYWDAEVRLLEPVNWIDPALRLFAEDPRVLVANPSWGQGLERETLEARGNFSLGYGFSDQVFLARRSALAAPIYRHRCVASWRYPRVHAGLIFEAQVDAYMRARRRLRGTYRKATYLHPTRPSRDRPRGIVEWLRWSRNNLATRFLRHLPLGPPSWRI
jgi:hypothetical protein